MRDQSITVRSLLAGAEQRLGIRRMAGQAGLSNCIERVQTLHANHRGVKLPSPSRRTLLVTPPEPLRRQLRTISTTAGEASHRWNVSCIFLGASDRISDQLIHFSEESNITILTSHFDNHVLESRLKGLWREKMHHRVLMHGVLIKVFGLGVLIRGESGCGKTRSALELVRKGHTWIADDVVDIRAGSGNRLYAKGHPKTRRLIDLKEDGIHQIHTLMGNASFSEETALHLVAEIRGDEDIESASGPDHGGAYVKILGTEIPRLVIPALPGEKGHAGRIEEKVRAFQSGGGLL